MSKTVDPFVDWDRPRWDECFMGVAYMMAMMSPDPATKHGAVIVDHHNRLTSVGFNGFPPDCDDSKLPTTRPDKYDLMEHAEANACNNATVDLEGMTIYVTGHPCLNCFRRLACNRIARIVYDPEISSLCVTDHDGKMIDLMNAKKLTGEKKIEISPFAGDAERCMTMAVEYRRIKIAQNKQPPTPSSAILCDHANEVPMGCDCPSDCYCRVEGSCVNLDKRNQ